MSKDLNQTDEQIAVLVQSGKIDFFSILIDRYSKKMTRYARRILSNQDDISDVVQEIFIKTYINIKSFDSNRKFSSWIYRIAHNEIVNVFKKNKRRAFLPIFDLDTFFPYYGKSKEPDAQAEAEREEIKQMIDTFLNQLGDKYREPIVLHYVEEFSYKEIADIMQIPIATVGVRISRAKQILKSLFEKNGYQQ